MGVTLEEPEVEVSGELDVRGTLAVDPDVRVGFEALECKVRLRAAPRDVEKLVAAAGRYCVNLDTLRDGLEVEVREQTQQEGVTNALR